MDETSDTPTSPETPEARPRMPSLKLKLIGWYLYSLSTGFVPTVLVPILFPLILVQITSPTSGVTPPLTQTRRDVTCQKAEMLFYQGLTADSITTNSSKFSPLRWIAVSWAATLLLFFPFLPYLAYRLDHSGNRTLTLILSISTILGSFPCLLTGFFRTTWLFPFYTLFLVLSATTGTAVHTHNLRRIIPNSTVTWHSSTATAGGCVGATVIAAFTYQMLRRDDQLTSLWVVSIFSGLLWSLGILHAFIPSNNQDPKPADPNSAAAWAHFLSVFKYSHLVGGIGSVFLSSFSSMCLFGGAILFLVGGLCIKPVILLAIWLIYFSFPMFSLSASYLLHLMLRIDAVRMQLLGFFMSAAASAVGFYYEKKNWHQTHIFLVVLLQSAASGVLHAFGQALVSDCSPAGKEGVVAAWFAWARAGGLCAGFTVAAVFPGSVRTTFGLAFAATAAGALVLVFGKVSHLGGAKVAGRLTEEEGIEKKGLLLQVHGLHRNREDKVSRG